MEKDPRLSWRGLLEFTRLSAEMFGLIVLVIVGGLILGGMPLQTLLMIVVIAFLAALF